MNRRTFTGLLAGAITAVAIGVTRRCDAAYLESMIASGKDIIGGTYHIHRPIKVPKDAKCTLHGVNIHCHGTSCIFILEQHSRITVNGQIKLDLPKPQEGGGA